MIGTYSVGDFHSGSGISGTVKITDPGVVHGGGGIQLGGYALGPRHNVDLPEIAFDAQTTLAFARNGGDVGGMLGVVDGSGMRTVAIVRGMLGPCLGIWV